MRSIKGRTTGAVLNEALVREIRLKGNKQGTPTRILAQDFGIGQETVRRILRYESWGWVTDEGPGAPAEAWAAGGVSPKVFTPEEMAASLARTMALAGLPMPVKASKSMPTMEESLAAAGRESDEVASRVAATFAAKDAASDAQLAGLLNPGGIQSTITDEHGGKLEPKD